MKKEIRRIEYSPSVTDESRTVYGKAISFDTTSNYMGFYETIHKGAVTQELLNNSDVFARMNHSDEYVLARCKNGKGSLMLELRDDGVYYLFECPNTEKGEELLEHIRRGELDGSSFAFTVDSSAGSERWYKDKDGELHRDIYKIGSLLDIAPVYSPAYSDTSVSLRADDVKKTSAEIDAKMELIRKELEEL